MQKTLAPSSQTQVKRRTIRRHRDGTVETHEHDGKVITEKPDGTVVTVHPCGRVETELRESTQDGDSNTSRNQTYMQTMRKKLCFAKGRLAPSDQEMRKMIIRGRRAGPSLPSSVARRLAEASEDLYEERPDVLLVGGQNVLPQMRTAIREEGLEDALMESRDIKAPKYLSHFAGQNLSDDWAPPEIDIDEEEREWRDSFQQNRNDPNRRSDRELLLEEFKFRKGFKRTEVEEEEWMFEQASRDRAFADRLRKVQNELVVELERASQREAKLKAREDRLKQEQLRAKKALSWLEEEEDIENRVYPDAVPVYLMDRPSYYFYPSKISLKSRVLRDVTDVGK